MSGAYTIKPPPDARRRFSLLIVYIIRYWLSIHTLFIDSLLLLHYWRHSCAISDFGI